MILLLLLAGHETTINLIGNGVLALLDHPEELARLRAEPSLIDSAIEELLRYTNPVQFPPPRHVKQDFVLHGVEIPRGAVLLPVIASANHDARAFQDPDRLDLGRSPNKHLALGVGVHYCLGAPLLRIEAKSAFLGLLARVSEIELSVPRTSIRWRSIPALRGLRALPVRLAR